MKIIKKLFAFGLVAAIAVSMVALPVSAASKSDYLQCSEATVTDKGTNKVNISGRGKFSTKKDPNNATAAIFKDTIDPCNFKVDFEFLQQYDPTDKTMGWYGLGITNKPYWLTTIPSIGRTLDYNGIMILFRCDPADKRTVSMEMGWWKGESVKNTVNNGFYLEPLKADWKLSLEVKDGKVYVDGKEYEDLNFYINRLFGDGPVFLSFGALSEKALGTSFDVTFANTAKRDAISMFHDGTLGKEEPVVSSKPDSGNKPVTSSKPAPNTTVTTSSQADTPTTSTVSTVSDTSVSSAVDATTSDLVSSESEDTTASETASGEMVGTGTTSESTESITESVSSEADTNTKPQNSNAWIWIVIIVVVILVAAGVVVFFVLKKKNETTK